MGQKAVAVQELEAILNTLDLGDYVEYLERPKTIWKLLDIVDRNTDCYELHIWNPLTHEAIFTNIGKVSKLGERQQELARIIYESRSG